MRSDTGWHLETLDQPLSKLDVLSKQVHGLYINVSVMLTELTRIASHVASVPLIFGSRFVRSCLCLNESKMHALSSVNVWVHVMLWVIKKKKKESCLRGVCSAHTQKNLLYL